MVLKLYGAPMSTCTRRVGAYLHEKKIPFEFILIDLAKAGQKAPDFLEKQPFGQVPVVEDDGFLVYESRAIIRYLEAKYGSQYPQLAPSTSNFKAYALRSGAKPDQGLVDNLLTQLEGKLNAYDVILSKQKYIGGNEYTLADLFHLPYGDGLMLAGYNVLLDSSRPNVVRWWKEISNREAWAQVKGGVKATTSY